VDNFRGVASVKMGSGNTFLFWSDNWEIQESSQPMKSCFPQLFSYVLEENMFASEVYSREDITSIFYLPLSQPAFAELQELMLIMQANPITDVKDKWSYVWGSKYTSAQFYKHIHAHIKVPRVYHWLWKSSCIMHTKFFAWMLLVDRLNTRDMLQRRHWHVTDDTHCELCPIRAYEDRTHLFFQCNFSTRIWNYLQIEWIHHDDLQVVVATARQRFHKPFFMEVVVVACWNIWLIRNTKIFQNERPTFTRWKCKFVHDMTLLQYRIKQKYKVELLDWIESLP
jgi:hypothetical protein